MASLLLVGSLVALTSCKKDEPVQPAEETEVPGIVKGTVTADDNTPLADVNVTLGSLSAVTSADGTYSFVNVKQDKCTVVFVQE